MPRIARASIAGMWYRVLNRGNRRATVIDKPAGFDAFVEAMRDATDRLPVNILEYCLMPDRLARMAER